MDECGWMETEAVLQCPGTDEMGLFPLMVHASDTDLRLPIGVQHSGYSSVNTGLGSTLNLSVLEDCVLPLLAVEWQLVCQVGVFLLYVVQSDCGSHGNSPSQILN